ncbi:MAG TPA: STAS domain-containing protein [Acidimicrobiales bacterium]|nr:STAS domain-containing protein [Acidimicrobiales bacterium]
MTLVDITVEEGPASTRAIVLLRGRVDVYGAADVAACLNALLDRGADVVVDLTNVDLIDSVGLLALFEARIRARRLGHRLTLQHPAGHLSRVLVVAPRHGGSSADA